MKILFMLLLTSLVAQAQEPEFSFDKEKGRSIPNFIGELKIFKGKVFRLTEGQLKAVQVGTRFFKGDTLVTEENSVAKVLIVDDSIMSVGPSSKLNFSEFKFADKTQRVIHYDLQKGQLVGHIKNRAREGDIIIRTKYTAMGVRGTRILVNYHMLNNLDVSEYALLSGSAVLTNEKNQKFDLKKGEHRVFIHDLKTSKYDSDMLPIKEDEFNALDAQKLNEETEFKPFLPYFEPLRLNESSSLQAFFHSEQNEAKTEKSGSQLDDKSKNPKHWKENLKKLNQQLKENQKKK